MIFVLAAITTFAHLIIPLIFIFWVYKSKEQNKIQWLSIVILTANYLIMLRLGGAAWHWFGFYWINIFITLFLIVTLKGWISRKNLNWLPEKNFKSYSSLAIKIALGILFFSSIPSFISAWSIPKEQSIELLFPLKGGTFRVGHGGSNESLNAHYVVHAQKYALDISKLNNFGTRARGLYPTDLQKYEVYGSEIVAPCNGEVIAVENNLPDQIPPKMDSKNLLGNHVILYCQGVSVLLAHLKQNTVKVKIDDKVQQGDLLGQAGNSGNTSEPHLHIHAVLGKHDSKASIAVTADPVVMLFSGKFLVRNDKFYSP